MYDIPATEHLRRLLSLMEAKGVFISPEDAEAMDLDDDDAQLHREQRMVKIIRQVFGRLKLAISPDRFAVSYDETPDREATVRLDDAVYGVSVRDLVALHDSGLADDYRVTAERSSLVLTFRVRPEIDTADLT